MHFDAPRLRAVVAAVALAAAAWACGGPTHQAGPEPEDLGVVGGKADRAALREVALTLEPGVTKLYRIKATGFVARVTQDGDVPVQLSAKHYEIDIYGEPSTAPTVTASSEEGSVRNWTLRVANLGEEVLHATVIVTELPTDPAVELGIVSDIDKTLLPPHDDEKPLPAPYPGVATLLTELELGSAGKPGDVTFVTARTPDRLDGISEWMAAHGIPAGPIETGTSGMPWIAEPEKVRDVSGVFDARPEQRFVLFGDSSHRDPEVYRTILETYPERVLAAFIHKVNNVNPDCVAGLHLMDSYAEAAALLFDLDLLDEAAARRVMTAARREGLALSDEEIDALLL